MASPRSDRVSRVLFAVAVVAILAVPAALIAAESPHLNPDGSRFPVGMFVTIDYPDDPAHYDFDLLDARFDSIWQGHPGSYEACNIVQFYDGPWRQDLEHKWEFYPSDLVNEFLHPFYHWSANSDGIVDPSTLRVRVVLGPLYNMFVTGDPSQCNHDTVGVCNHDDAPPCPLCAEIDAAKPSFMDHHLEPGLLHLQHYMDAILDFEAEHSGFIAGWYMADEPDLSGWDLAEYYKLVDTVRAMEDARPNPHHLPMYVALAAAAHLTDDPELNTFADLGNGSLNQWIAQQQVINWNGTLYGVTQGATHLYTWEEDNQLHETTLTVTKTIGDVIWPRFPTADGTYQGEWPYTMWEADHVMPDYYAPLTESSRRATKWGYWVTQARNDFRELGSKRYGDCGEPCDWYFDAVIPSFVRNGFPAHKDMHGYIRHVEDLNVDGIWFFSWRPVHEWWTMSAGRGYWLGAAWNWSQAVENEIEGQDEIIASWKLDPTGTCVLQRFGIEYDTYLRHGSFGAMTPIPTGGSTACVTRAASGDFDGDGDADLVLGSYSETVPHWSLDMYELTFSGSPPTYMWRKYPLPLPTEWVDQEVLDVTSGDFNCDGRDELAIACQYTIESEPAWCVEAYKFCTAWRTGGGLRQPDHFDTVLSSAGDDVCPSAITAGDFDGNGADELLMAFSTPSDPPGGNESHWMRFADGIFSTDGVSVYGSWTTQSLIGVGSVLDLTAGDYDGDTDESILIFTQATDDEGRWRHNLQRVDLGLESPWGQTYDYLKVEGRQAWVTDVLPDQYDLGLCDCNLTVSMTTGDFDSDRDDETVLSVYEVFDGSGEGCRVMHFLEEGDFTMSEATEVSPPDGYDEWDQPLALTCGDLTVSDLPTGGGKKPKQEEPPDPLGRPATPTIPSSFALRQGSPNPFNPVTIIEYDVPESAPVTLAIYNLAGREVRGLIDGQVEPGRHAVTWDGKDDHGTQVASGIYFCRMLAPQFEGTGKLVLIK